ncbi:MAG: glycoside hydrolase family 130 protein [Anaerolineae bacterium]|jgi:predicted GH43/DUF377 family glycosyl hydrolase
MPDLAKRFPENPLIMPRHVNSSREGLRVQLVLNPGAFRFEGKTWLIMRVAEHPEQREGYARTVVADPDEPGGVAILEFDLNDPDVEYEDPRHITYKGESYLSSISHLRLASSEDGVHFEIEDQPVITAQGPMESYGIEDCRVTELDGRYWLTYTVASPRGIGVALASTVDWREFTRHGVILPPTNKDCAIFPGKANGRYAMLHRPIGVFLGGPFIWLAYSDDMEHWGHHHCVVRTRSDMWDSARVGAGAAPIYTDEGWLEIYHGANHEHRYCLGALLLDLEDPCKVIARSEEPIMEPLADYERAGFFGEVVFTNGHIVDGDTITMYYGASDAVICGATLSIREILDSLGR